MSQNGVTARLILALGPYVWHPCSTHFVHCIHKHRWLKNWKWIQDQLQLSALLQTGHRNMWKFKVKNKTKTKIPAVTLLQFTIKLFKIVPTDQLHPMIKYFYLIGAVTSWWVKCIGFTVIRSQHNWIPMGDFDWLDWFLWQYISPPYSKYQIWDYFLEE